MNFPSVPKPSPEACRNAALLIPLILVNGLAVWGQAGWAADKLPGDVWASSVAAVAFAGALESIGVYLAYEAHVARLAGDSAGWLAASAYGVAGFAAYINWSHWSSTSATLALVFAAMSGISPWLWSIRSRSIHRAQLREAGLIEGRAVKFGRARWVLYPRLTFKVFRAAVWAGEVDPASAIAAYSGRPTSTSPTPDAKPDVKPLVKTTSGQPVGLTSGSKADVEVPDEPAPVKPTKPPVKAVAALRSARPSRPTSTARTDGRTYEQKVDAVIDAVQRGDLTAPVTSTSVRSIVTAGGGQDRVIRDEVNARLAQSKTSGDVA